MTQTDHFKIACVIARLNVGGAAAQAILMTQVLRDRGHHTLLLTGEVAPGERSMEYLAREMGVEPIRIATMSRRISVVNDLVSLWRLIRIFQRERPTILHTHTAKAGALGRIAAILTGVPVRVHTFHGHVFSGYFSPAVTRIFIAIERFLARHTDRILAVSDLQRKDLVEIYGIAPGSKVQTLPYGLDLQSFLGRDGRNRNMHSLPSGERQPPVVGWVGRLTAIKQPELVVEIAALVRQLCPAVRFVVVGDGELRSALQTRVADAGLGGVVELLGSREDMPGVYAEFDFLLLTSRNEGTPVTILEAMASGKAFVATDVGGVRDLAVGPGHREDGFEIFDNGILAPVDSPVLARAVRFLAGRPDLCSRMGAAGRAFVVQRYSHVRLADDLECLYRDLARTKAGLPLSQVLAVPQK